MLIACVGRTFQLLDLASGPGEPGCTIAKTFPDINVTITDVSEDQVQLASKNSCDLQNVTCLVADAQDLGRFQDNSFDVVTNCYGYMFCDDLPAAIRETYRVLKPGGSLIATYWLQLPAIALARAALGAALTAPPPPPNIDPLTLSQPGFFPSMLQKEHFVDITTSASQYPLDSGASPEDAFVVGTLVVRAQLADIPSTEAQIRAQNAFWEAWERSEHCNRREDGVYTIGGNIFEMVLARKQK